MSSLDDNALITTEDLKAYLDMKDSTQDKLLEILINAISTLFDQYTSRNLKEATYTDLYLDGNGEEIMYLPDWPIGSITSIAEDSVALTEGEDNDYYLYADEGYLVRISAVWLKGYKTIKITYKAGYLTVPKDLQLACMEQVAYEWQRQKNRTWGESSKSKGDFNISYIKDDLLSQVKKVLDSYRKMTL